MAKVLLNVTAVRKENDDVKLDDIYVLNMKLNFQVYDLYMIIFVQFIEL